MKQRRPVAKTSTNLAFVQVQSRHRAHLVKHSSASSSYFSHPALLPFDPHILPFCPLVKPGRGVSALSPASFHLKAALHKYFILHPPSPLQLLLISSVLNIMTTTSGVGPQMPSRTAAPQVLKYEKVQLRCGVKCKLRGNTSGSTLRCSIEITH